MNDVFEYRDDVLVADGIPLSEIAASHPTPFYVYVPRALVSRYRKLDAAFSGSSHFHAVALKANTQPALLRHLVNEGAGAEVVSGAELALALALGFAPSKIVFSGVGKTERELRSGVIANVAMLLVESEQELRMLDAIAARAGRRASVALRLNPDIDAGTHRHIATGIKTAKFGLDAEQARQLYAAHREFSALDFVGVHSHIGSQITALEPLAANARILAEWVRSLRGIGVELKYVDIGGGVGIRYHGERAPSFDGYAESVIAPFADLDVTIVTEPGRILFGPVGAFVVRVLYVKRVHERGFLVVDAGLNDFLRPALYGAYHRIVPLRQKRGAARTVDVVGAVCESSDVFARDRSLVAPEPGDFLAILDAGAYGFVMSSNYNLRARPAELVVEEGRFRIVRTAETEEELVARELAGGG
ncbi:MAG TPA: diaminopimelate decarboxylase [Vicinamibacteria bacterium]|nr:diaminopimelate decarboxylase [Vicinamibacteria bacterium]